MSMDALKIWLLVAATGFATYATRLSFIAIFTRREMPRPLQRALHYVPPAMLMALIAPGLVLAGDGALALSLFNPRLVSACIAGAVAFRTRSTTWTIVVGMIALWLLEAGRNYLGH